LESLLWRFILFCSQCGEKLAEGAMFCSQCGAKVNGIIPVQPEPYCPPGQPVAVVRQIKEKKQKLFVLIWQKKLFFGLMALLVLATGVWFFRRQSVKDITFFSVDLDRQVTLGTPISFSGSNLLPDELQWLAVHIACIGVYNNAQAGNYTLGDPTDYYQPGDIRDFLTGRSGNETKTDMFYGICFNYAQAAYDDIMQNQSRYKKLGVRKSYIAGVLDDPGQILLYEPVSSSEADTTMNGVYVKTASRQNVRSHNDTTWHSWLWVYGNDGEVYWIDPTWTDNTGYVVWGVVRNGEEIQLNPLESLCKVSVNPSDDSFAWINKGNASKNRSEYEQAIKDYTIALEKDSNDASIYVNRGIAFCEMRDFSTGIDDFNEAIRLSPDLSSAYTLRGRALCATVVTVTDIKPKFSNFTYETDDGWDPAKHKLVFEKAMSDFNQAIRLDPNDAVNYYERGSAYQMKREYDNAITDYNQALKRNPGYLEVYKNRREAYFSKGDYNHTIADCDQTILLDPNDIVAYNYRGAAFAGKGDYNQAIVDFSQAIRLSPNDANAYAYRGAMYSFKNDYDRAIADFNQSIRLDPNYAYAYFFRGSMYYDKREWNRAIADYEATLRIDPNNTYARKGLTDARRARGW